MVMSIGCGTTPGLPGSASSARYTSTCSRTSTVIAAVRAHEEVEHQLAHTVRVVKARG
jgi:hypothetical protein